MVAEEGTPTQREVEVGAPLLPPGADPGVPQEGVPPEGVPREGVPPEEVPQGIALADLLLPGYSSATKSEL